MIHAHPTMKLGRPGGPSTRHGAKMATLVDKTKVQAPPLALDIGGPEYTRTWLNDSIGDCTCATWAGIFRHDAAAQGQDVDFFDDAVLTMYKASGYDGTPETDRGWTLEAAANYAQTVGLRDTAGIVHKAGPHLSISHTDEIEVQIALSMFGALPVGVQLPIAAQSQDVWDTDGSDGDQTPNGWGGHSLTLIGYDHDYYWFRTWGRRKPATRPWFRRYVDEIIAKIDLLWCSGERPAPDGFLLDDLIAAQGVLR